MSPPVRCLLGGRSSPAKRYVKPFLCSNIEILAAIEIRTFINDNITELFVSAYLTNPYSNNYWQTNQSPLLAPPGQPNKNTHHYI